MTATTNYRSSSAAFVRSTPRRLMLAMRSAPRVAVALFPTAAWIVVSVGLGLLLGLAAVILPPTGTFGIVAVAGVVLLWAMPDLAMVPTTAVRKTFIVMLIVSLTVPAYYTLVIPGLPWVSARRLATFAMILPFAAAMAGSSVQRRRIAQVFLGSNPLSTYCLGYLAIAVISTITSRQVSTSSSMMVDIILTWYVPLFAVIFISKSEDDILLILKIIIFSAIFVAIVAVFEFITLRQFFFAILPKPVLTMILQANPALSAGGFPFRNGNPRVASLFSNALSLGEFQAMVGPLAYYFIAHGKSAKEKILGVVAAFLCLAAIYCSGSRGAYSCLIIATMAFVGLWLVRNMRFNRYSLLPAFGGVAAAIIFGTLVVLIFTWGRLHNMVLGGGAEASSDVARYVQWASGLPKIIASPIVGYGLGSSGTIVGYFNANGDTTIDSFALAVLVENGIPGFVFFFGMIVVGIWFGAREYLTNLTRSGEIAGSLACSLIAYGIYRINLAQRENQLLFFVIIGMLMWLMNARASAAKERSQPSSAPIVAGNLRGRVAAASA